MMDLHLINTALVGLGIGAAVIVLLAAAIIAVAAMVRGTATGRRIAAGAPTTGATAHWESLGSRGHARSHENLDVREPALR